MKKYKSLALISFIVLLILADQGYGRDEITKNEVMSDGKSRTYYLFVPKSIGKDSKAPLIVLLHGSGHNGRLLVEHWQKLAEKEGIMLAGPDAQNPAFWGVPADGPKFISDLVEEIKSKYPVNSQRVYLFGHSAGARYGLRLALLESNYFAAAAVSAGDLQPNSYNLFDDAERKIPVAIFVGTQDPLFPLPVVRQTRDAFVQREFIAELTEIPGFSHDYYSQSKDINEKAWNFLKKYQLEGEPKYKQYNFVAR